MTATSLSICLGGVLTERKQLVDVQGRRSTVAVLYRPSCRWATHRVARHSCHSKHAIKLE